MFKVHIFWEGHKILRNLHLTFIYSTYREKLSGDFATFCGLLRIYELYPKIWHLHSSKFKAFFDLLINMGRILVFHTKFWLKLLKNSLIFAFVNRKNSQTRLDVTRILHEKKANDQGILLDLFLIKITLEKIANILQFQLEF